jgi:hypothetical protein
MRRYQRKYNELLIELILSQTEDENENEKETENENDRENEDDEIENKQYQNRFNTDTKINDVKDKNAVNRLHFMKLKS